MAPNLLGSSALFLAEATTTDDSSKLGDLKANNYQNNAIPSTSTAKPEDQQYPQYRWDIVWRNVIAFVYLHVTSVYGLYLFFFEAKWITCLWSVFVTLAGGFGVTGGTHRLWAHRCYKAKWPLRVILMLCQTIAFQNHIYEWCRDHRVHHKYTDTDADPHNSKRGFFFSHMGWLMVKKQRDVMIKGRTVDLSDLEKDWVVVFQMKTYLILMPLLCFVMPAFVPWYFWGEAGWTSWYVCAIFRYTFSLNCTWLVNSAAHIYGTRPYDNTISPTENKVTAYLTMGEGWHNFHHTFPWDYKAAELGKYQANYTTALIDMFAKIGWAYDLKTVSKEMIMKRATRTGDGSLAGTDGTIAGIPGSQDYSEVIWGWDDKDMKQEDKNEAAIYNQKEVKSS